MNSSSAGTDNSGGQLHRNCKVFGIVFLLLLPFCLVVAGVYAFSLPLLYGSRATMKLNFPEEDGSKLQAAMEWGKQQLVAKLPHPDDSLEPPIDASLERGGMNGSVSLVVRHTDASKAAERANQLALQIRDYLSAKVREAEIAKSEQIASDAQPREDSEVARHFRVELLEPAVAAKEPFREHFDRAMRIGISLGLLFGLTGVALLIYARQPANLVPVEETKTPQRKTSSRRRSRKGRYDY